MSTVSQNLSCPSTQPTAEGARVFGIVLGDVAEPRVSYLGKGVEVTAADVEALGGVSPTRVFRFAGKCMEGGCGQFKDGGCRLGKDIRKNLAAVADRVPPCTIRSTCRWFAENGPEVCLRCARVVTTVLGHDAALSPIADLRG